MNVARAPILEGYLTIGLREISDAARTLDAEAVLTFSLLPPGLMRALIARIGHDAGLAGEMSQRDEVAAERAEIPRLGRRITRASSRRRSGQEDTPTV